MLHLVTLLSFCTFTHADDHMDFAIKQAEALRAEAHKLIENGSVIEDLFTPKQGCKTSLLTSAPKENKQPKILIFISLSMPDISLKSLAQEAQKHNAVLIMRGLYEDSFAKTAQKLKDLNLSVDIHPELFETHKITSVPIFIELHDNKPIQRLAGNVSLSFCLSKFEEQL